MAEDPDGLGASAAATGEAGGAVDTKAARACRVVRVIRLVRLVRILKLYKHVHDHKVKREQRMAQHGQVTPGVISEDKAEDEDVAEEMRLAQEPESKVGRKLSELS